MSGRKRRRQRQRQRGFSVLEALLSIVMFLALLTAVFAIYAPNRLIYSRGEIRADVQQNARLAMAEMARQIRLAGYFPENFSATPPTPLVADAILVATDRALAFHGDADGSAVSNAFMFCLDGDVLRRSRAAASDAAAYTCSAGELLAENVVDLRFTYYDAAGNPLPDPPSVPFQLDGQSPGSVPDVTTTTQRGAVRRVVFTLTTETEAPQRGPQTYVLTSDVWLRNSG